MNNTYKHEKEKKYNIGSEPCDKPQTFNPFSSKKPIQDNLYGNISKS